MDVVNNSGGNLVFPDGEQIAVGGTRKLTDADMKNVGVKEWIDAGWLVKAAPVKSKTKTEVKP